MKYLCMNAIVRTRMYSACISVYCMYVITLVRVNIDACECEAIYILNQSYNATRKWLDFRTNMGCRPFYPRYIAPLPTENLWCIVSNVSTARLSER